MLINHQIWGLPMFAQLVSGAHWIPAWPVAKEFRWKKIFPVNPLFKYPDILDSHMNPCVALGNSPPSAECDWILTLKCQSVKGFYKHPETSYLGMWLGYGMTDLSHPLDFDPELKNPAVHHFPDSIASLGYTPLPDAAICEGIKLQIIADPCNFIVSPSADWNKLGQTKALLTFRNMSHLQSQRMVSQSLW